MKFILEIDVDGLTPEDVAKLLNKAAEDMPFFVGNDRFYPGFTGGSSLRGVKSRELNWRVV